MATRRVSPNALLEPDLPPPINRPVNPAPKVHVRMYRQMHTRSEAVDSLPSVTQPCAAASPQYPSWEVVNAPKSGWEPQFTGHISTLLEDGRQSIVIDTGSVGNLCGNEWATAVARLAKKAGRDPKYVKRDRPMSLCGVGHGSQEAKYNCQLPIAFRRVSDGTSRSGTLDIPTISHSPVPGLWGFRSLQQNRVVIDFTTLKLYMLGPSDYDLLKSMPSGTEVFQCERAPSGHLVLPCCEYENGDNSGANELTLITEDTVAPSVRVAASSVPQGAYLDSVPSHAPTPLAPKPEAKPPPHAPSVKRVRVATPERQ